MEKYLSVFLRIKHCCMTWPNPSCLTCKTRGCSLLNNCSDPVLKEISAKKIFRQVKQGEIIFTEGKEAIQIAFVKSGVIKMEVNGKNNRPLITRLAMEGDILGHRTLENFNRYPVSAVAVENSQLCLLRADHFHSLLERCADFRKEIIKAYLQELKEIETRTMHLVQKNVREKIAYILLYIAGIYKYNTQATGIHIHLTRQDMADLTGTTKEQVSKILTDFKNEKLINYRAKRFKFFDLEKLRAIAFCYPE